jgi:NAD-dependent SIR2 family protein deacetylase
VLLAGCAPLSQFKQDASSVPILTTLTMVMGSDEMVAVRDPEPVSTSSAAAPPPSKKARLDGGGEKGKARPSLEIRTDHEELGVGGGGEASPSHLPQSPSCSSVTASESDGEASVSASNSGYSSSSSGSSRGEGEKEAAEERTPGGMPMSQALDRWILRHRSRGSDLQTIIELLSDELGLELELAGEGSSEEETCAWYQSHEEHCWVLVRRLLLYYHHAKQRAAQTFRSKIDSINTLEDVADAILKAKNIVVLTGAGISVSCGIPDFRSENGIYSLLGEYNLPSPQAMFDIRYFRVNPVPFFSFARQLLPGNYTPSATHRFISLLSEKGKLLRNYTQNIDSLEKVAGVPANKVHQCHGSFDTATCTHCRHKVPLSAIEAPIRSQLLPMCDECTHPDGILKPDIVFFGESLGDEFAQCLSRDRPECDLVLVMGSSLQVAPVNQIVGWMPRNVPMVLINREVVGQPHKFDVELLGDSDAIVARLCELLSERSAPSKGSAWTLGGETTAVEAGAGAASFEAPNTYLFRNAKPKVRKPEHLVVDSLFDLDGEHKLDEGTLRAPWTTTHNAPEAA